MIEERKLKELDKNMEDRKKELEALTEKRDAAEMEPEELVILDKQISRLKNTIQVLERTREAVTYLPPAPTKLQQLVSGLDKYLDEKQKKIQKVQDSISKTTEEIQEKETLLHKATVEGETETVVKVSAELQDLKEQMKYLVQMKEHTAAIRTFPEGAIEKEWKMVCKDKKKDWDMLLQRIDILAAEYKSACEELLAMNDLLRTARKEMKRIGEQHGEQICFHPILTSGENIESLKISKMDGLKPGLIMNPEMGMYCYKM